MESIQTIIDNFLLKREEERKSRVRSGKWSPSSFGQCFRRQYWNRLDEPSTNPIEVNTLRRFECGNLFHNFVKSFLSNYEFEVKVESHDVLGYADGVHEKEVLEIKSQHSRKFWRQSKEENPIEKQNPEHILQCAWYAMELNKEFIHLLYVSKDDLCINEWKIPLTDEIRKEVNLELKRLNLYWDDKKLPLAQPRLYLDSKEPKKECTYCKWKDKCWAIEGWG